MPAPVAHARGWQALNLSVHNGSKIGPEFRRCSRGIHRADNRLPSTALGRPLKKPWQWSLSGARVCQRRAPCGAHAVSRRAAVFEHLRQKHPLIDPAGVRLVEPSVGPSGVTRPSTCERCAHRGGAAQWELGVCQMYMRGIVHNRPEVGSSGHSHENMCAHGSDLWAAHIPIPSAPVFAAEAMLEAPVHPRYRVGTSSIGSLGWNRDRCGADPRLSRGLWSPRGRARAGFWGRLEGLCEVGLRPLRVALRSS